MFQKQSATSSMAQAETVIGPSVKVEGDLKGVGNVLIEGILSGTLSTDKDVTIGEGAQIQANITAQNATIAGTINGSITINGHLTIKSTAKISGDINTKTIAVESGSRINGHLKMGEMPAAEHKSGK